MSFDIYNHIHNKHIFYKFNKFYLIIFLANQILYKDLYILDVYIISFLINLK